MFLVFIIAGMALAVIYASLMLWYLYGWLKTPVFSPASALPQTKVSVIIAARNEEANIGSCLESILKQDYPTHLFEIIVVDDHSSDGTADVVRKYERVQLIQLSARPGSAPFDSAQGDNAIGHSERSRTMTGNEGGGKKAAIEKGIEAATGQLIVTTDADCTMGAQWLSTFVAYYETYQPAMIAGPVYFHKANGALGIWQTLDFAGLMGITAAGIQLHFPQMCNGANLAYEKAAFQAVGGFSGIDDVPTGDDILLMLKIASLNRSMSCRTRFGISAPGTSQTLKQVQGDAQVRHDEGKIGFLKSPDAIVYTSPQPALMSLAAQRLRWVSKSKVFPDPRINAVLVMAWLTNFFVLAVFFLVFAWPAAFWFFLMLLFIKTLFELPLVYFSLRLSSQTRYIWHLPWVQFLHLFYVVILGPASLFSKYEWKGRKY